MLTLWMGDGVPILNADAWYGGGLTVGAQSMLHNKLIDSKVDEMSFKVFLKSIKTKFENMSACSFCSSIMAANQGL